MPVPEFVTSWFGSGPLAALIFFVAAGVLLLTLLTVLWLLVGPGPRRRRAYRRAQQLLEAGHWAQALVRIEELQRKTRSARWQNLLLRAEGECRRAAGDQALEQKEYEAGLDHFLKAAELFNRTGARSTREGDVRTYVVETMLAEVRRLFAGPAPGATGPVLTLIQRTLAVQSPCPEASFWQALCHLREGTMEPALAALRQARGGGDAEGPPPTPFLDPSLYLGTLLLREGRADEALRYLAEANRMDANCPFVTWQLGTAMLAGGGDAQIAVRALQRALGPRGLLLWVKNPQRAWVEAFPEKRSYVRRLAAQYPFSCPLFGNDVALMIRQGQITLGQGMYRLGNFEESAKVFGKLLGESVPTLPVLRGLGLALARLDQFDQAFKHLRAAHDLEEPKTFLTAGYLALCGAKGKPIQPEDKAKNVLWAIRVVGRFNVPRHPEWAGLLSRIFDEARSINLPIPPEDQQRLCETLLSVAATDPLAAGAYAHLAATYPEAVRPEYAWLYCRAAQEHGYTSPQDLDLFARTFATEADARAFFGRQQWDFDEVEFTYLERGAARQPGQFPPALGPDYPARGERFLLGRSEWLEQMDDREGALASAEVLLKLAPHSPRAHDRLAQLAYRAGDLTRAAALLEAWHQLAPADPVPLVRRAVIEQQRGQPQGRAQAIREALALTRGKDRAEIAFLGARLALQEWLPGKAGSDGEASRNGDASSSPYHASQASQEALALLRECREADPEHRGALWCLASLCAVLQRDEELAALAPDMRRLLQGEGGRDAHFAYLAAVGLLAAGDYTGAVEAAGRAAELKPELAAECAYVQGWARWLAEDPKGACQALRQPAQETGAASHPNAQALLGRIHFAGGEFGEAVIWWKALDPAKRSAWKIEEPLRGAQFAAATRAFREGRFGEASERYRDAGRLGLRDRRLGPLLALALLRAGQRLLFENT